MFNFFFVRGTSKLQNYKNNTKSMLLHQGTWYIWFESYSSSNCSYSVLAVEIKTGCYSNRARFLPKWSVVRILYPVCIPQFAFYTLSVFYTQSVVSSPRFIPSPYSILSPQSVVHSPQSIFYTPTDLLTVSESFKVCHIAHCYSKMLKKRPFHWLPWTHDFAHHQEVGGLN